MSWPKVSSDTINSSKILLTGTMVEEKAERGARHEDMCNQTASSTFDLPLHLGTHFCRVDLHKTFTHKKKLPQFLVIEALCLLGGVLDLNTFPENGCHFFSFV